MGNLTIDYATIYAQARFFFPLAGSIPIKPPKSAATHELSVHEQISSDSENAPNISLSITIISAVMIPYFPFPPIFPYTPIIKKGTKQTMLTYDSIFVTFVIIFDLLLVAVFGTVFIFYLITKSLDNIVQAAYKELREENKASENNKSN